MTRLGLLHTIAAIYAKACESKDMFNYNRDINTEIRKVNEALSAISQVALPTPLNADAGKARNVVIDSLTKSKHALETTLEELNSELYPVFNDAKKFTVSLAKQYINAVTEFSDSGEKGFYDCVMIMRTEHVSVAEQIILSIKEMTGKGLDIVITEDLRSASDDDQRILLSFMLPSSIYHIVLDFLQRNKSIKSNSSTETAFIAPCLHDRADDLIVEAKELLTTLREDNEGGVSWSSFAAYTASGIMRSELMHLQPNPMLEAIARVFIDVDLYLFTTDHINGLMPSIYCYDYEIQKFNLRGSANKLRRSIRNEVIIFQSK